MALGRTETEEHFSVLSGINLTIILHVVLLQNYLFQNFELSFYAVTFNCSNLDTV
jgi:hypothetical protein